MEENSIKNRDHILKVFFQMVSSHEILNGNIDWRQFPEKEFSRLCGSELSYLSDTEISANYSRMKESREEDKSELNVFRLLKKVVGEILIVRNDQPACRYECLLRWRMLVQVLGEDLPICAFLACRTESMTGGWNDFEWNTVISHDNLQLTRILKKGCADNHFHLFGSAPSFQLIWLKLMNHPANSRCRRAIRDLDAKKRVASVIFAKEELDDPLEELVYKAALIRYTLVLILYRAVSRNLEDIDDIDAIINNADDLLNYPGNLNFGYEKLQRRINGLRQASSSRGSQNDVDYALVGSSGSSIHHDFEGERAFLYRMLLGYEGSFQITPTMMKWFYAYTVIKGKLYREFVQVNDMVGFANFSIYSSRKSGFLFSKEDYNRMVRHAVMETFENKAVFYLEMRITPLNSVKSYRETILAYDSCISNGYGNSEILDKCCYVIHFARRLDEKLPSQPLSVRDMLTTCRHQKYREKIGNQATQLVNFRMKAQNQAKRVRGIDACAMEIGCRPEVFGPIFRRLSEHVVPGRNVHGVCQLKTTFHVGEDFLDLADGLRAIDEAILFLNMKRGDRLGHATALGLDVKSWYQSKKRVINLPLHDYLDNVVWLYHKLVEYDIRACENLKEYLLIEYNKIFDQIYGECLDLQFVDDIARKIDIARNGSSGVSGRKSIKDFHNFGIHTFYQAWKLRGDDPLCYYNDTYVGSMAKKIEYKERINWTIPDGDDIRYNPETVVLYLMYHYSVGVRMKGAAIYKKELPLVYIEGVDCIQKKMQWMVASRGIGIETNPSSNYQISTIRRYQDHPISSLYNLGLTSDSEELRNCPQMNVSINTDDRGVFHTSLENEFALMGCAMEYIDKGDGTFKYRGQAVYEWLDRIREMGIGQRFME